MYADLIELASGAWRHGGGTLVLSENKEEMGDVSTGLIDEIQVPPTQTTED
jgi:hypothetical protein